MAMRRDQMVAGLIALLAGAAAAPAAKARTFSTGVDPLQALDVYAPAGRGPFPILAFLHGGGWRIGDKSNPAAGAEKAAVFTPRGFVYASLNYRLSPAVRHPAHVEDVAAGLAWLIANAQRFGGDPRRLFLMGHSAGAHLAALAAIDKRRLGAHGLGLSALKGVILLDGAGYDVAPQVQGLQGGPTFTREMYEDAFGTDPAGWADASPVTHIAANAGIAPFLIVHTDRLPAVRQSTMLAERLRTAGVSARLYRARGKSHAQVNREIGAPAGAALTAEIFKALSAWGA